jgi:DNA-binding response OmpR family regulator
VKEFTGLLGGSIDVESKEGEGTIFTLKLPLTWATGTEQILPAIKSTANFSILEKLVPEDKKETKPLLLLVEDNQEMLHFLSQALADTYRVLRATNGREGLEIARKELPEVVISDVMMPKMDGYAFCQALKTDPYTDHIAVLLLTARTSQDSRMEGLSLGADDYIAKPFHLEELRLRLHNLLDRQAKLREYYYKQWNTLEATISLPGAKDAFTEKLYSLIEANLDNPALDPEILASEVAMSVRTLNRKLHTVMGIPAAKLIRVYRLKRAATLLKSGQSVSDTAYQIGFESPSYFATAFKEYYQKTPSEYVAC